jgi:microcystin degradation protein MlrC
VIGKTLRRLQRGGRKGRPLRIAYGRIFHEANAFSPLPTEQEAFERFHFHEGDAVTPITERRNHELADVLRNAELSGFVSAAAREGDVECVPLFSTLAVSGGPITAECFAWLRDRLVHHLERVGEVDAVYLALHGSMRVQGLKGAPEGVLISDVRSVMGDTPLAVSYDLHANLSPAIVETTDILEGFRTNPHRDLYSTGFRAGTQIIRTVRGEIEPVRAWRKLPIILGGGTTIDFFRPMRPLFRHIRALARRPGVVSAHIFMVHPYSDATDLGWAVHVCTDGNAALANRLADELADKVWAVRDAPLPPMRSPEQAIDEVRAARIARATGHVSLVDIGDVVGTGSPGGCTQLLDTLVRVGSDLSVYIPVHDPAAIDDLWANHRTRDRVDVTLRGTPGLTDQPEVQLDAVIEARRDTDFGRTVLLRCGELRIAVTERPPYTVSPKFWSSVGLSAWKADAIVQKALFHYRFFYVASVRKNIPVVTAGPSSLDNIRNLRFDMPVYPQDDVADWRAFDQVRRASASSAARTRSTTPPFAAEASAH